MEYTKATTIEEAPFCRFNSDRRLTLEDNFMTGVLKMSENNPGSMACLMELSEVGPKMHPSDFMGHIGPMMNLDELGIHSEHIYLLWNDCCNKNTEAMIVFLKGCNFGLYDRRKLLEAININSFRGHDIEFQAIDLLKKIQDKYPGFNDGKPLENTPEPPMPKG